MDGKSLNLTQELLQQLQQLVPQAFSEGKLDTTALKRLLGEDVFVQGERYGLNWAGKTEAYQVLQQQTTTTLLPESEQSVDWDHAEHVLIEGENLEVLKLLQKSYFGQIKMIYIDPPYNTGKDSFIYPDKFSETKEEYLQRIGDKNDEGYMLREGAFRPNRKENGQYHSNWLNMMLPRLYLARNLLRDDGVIFVSIDDNEAANLKLLMDEVFGAENMLAQFVWRTDGNFDNQAKVKNCHEYVLAYGKSLVNFPAPPTIAPTVSNSSKLYKDEIRNTIVKNGPANPVSEITLPIGFPVDFDQGVLKARKDIYPIYLNDAKVENGKILNSTVIKSGWSSKDLFLKFVENGLQSVLDNKGQETSFILSKTGALEVVKKRLENQSHVISVLSNVGNTQKTSAQLKKEEIHFDFPKPVQLIKYLISMNTGKNFLALDFFTGSGTTAQAVMELNEEDGGNRRYICVQLPEKTEEGKAAAKAGYATIADITAARIKKVIEKIEAARAEKTDLLNENKPLPNLGFRKFTLAPSNFKLWRGDVIETEADLLRQMHLFTTPQRATATTSDMAWELLLKNGYGLSEPVTVLTLDDGLRVYHTADGHLALVLDGFSAAVQDAVLALRPKQVLLLDSLFAGLSNGDAVKTNAQLTCEDQGIAFRTV